MASFELISFSHCLTSAVCSLKCLASVSIERFFVWLELASSLAFSCCNLASS